MSDDPGAQIGLVPAPATASIRSAAAQRPSLGRQGDLIYKLYRHHRPVGTNTDTLEAVRPLTAQEESQYFEALKHLQEFAQLFDLPVLVDANLDDVRAELARFESEHKQTARGALNQDPTDRRVLQRVMINYLNAVRLYLDHRATHLTRRYGPGSAPRQAFDATRRNQHATVPEYAFVYELRNYVQHCGMPLQAIRAHQEIVSAAEGERMEATVLVGCNKGELLSKFDDWRYSRAFIEAQADEFAILPVLERMRDCLSEIETATMNAVMVLLWPEAQFVCRLLAEATSESRIGLVANLDLSPTPGGRSSMKLGAPPYSVLHWMRLLELTPGPPGYRFVEAHLSMTTPPRVV